MTDLNEALLTEAFDTVEGYNVVNMKPNSGSPQIFLIQNDADNLIVRMMALSGDGDKVRVLKPTDKNIIVELMSINDTGRHIVLKGGIGSNPMKTIVTIFDTVMENLNLNIVESIMFRFQPKKMGGQVRSIQRILERLAITRGKGKFVPLKELNNITGKFAYVVMHKRRLDIEKLPGAKNVPEKFKKVETKVGEVFVDEKTGVQASKSDVVAQAISDTVNKISDKEVVIKTKLSRKEIMTAMYNNETLKAKRLKSDQATFNRFSDENVVVPKNESAIARRVSKLNMTQIAVNLMSYQKGAKIYDQKAATIIEKVEKDVRNAVDDYLKVDMHTPQNDSITENIIREFGKIVKNADPLDLQTSVVEMAEMISKTSFGGMEYKNQVKMMKELTSTFLDNIFFTQLTNEYLDVDANDENRDDYTKEEIDAIEKYTDFYYRKINDFLIGRADMVDSKDIKIMEGLDSALKKGVKLPEKTVLYRGQSMPMFQYTSMIKMKAIYFKNYVSASMFPVIYGSMTNASPTIIPGTEVIDTMDDFVKSPIVSDDIKGHLDAGTFPTNINRESISMSLVIKKANKVGVIIPGKLSAHPYELEVILPRGIALKVNKITGQSDGPSYNTMLLDTEVMSNDELNECNEFVDGDHLMETGEIKTFSFSNMYNKMHLNEAVIPDNPEATDLLLSCLNFDAIPERMK